MGKEEEEEKTRRREEKQKGKEERKKIVSTQEKAKPDRELTQLECSGSESIGRSWRECSRQRENGHSKLRLDCKSPEGNASSSQSRQKTGKGNLRISYRILT